MRLLLWKLWQQKQGRDVKELPPPPANGLTSVPVDENWPEGYALVAGYRPCKRRAVRVDMLERLGDMIRDRVFWKPRFTGEERPAGSVEGGGFTVIPDMMSLVGCSGEDFAAVLETLGYRSEHRKVKVEKTAEEKPAEAKAEKSETTEAETTSEEAPAAEQAKGETAVVEQTEQAEPEQAEPEEVEIVVWWPDGTGPFRRKKPVPRDKGRAPGKHGKPARGKDDKKGKPRPRGRKAGTSRRKARMPDPDSPFAVLAKLKMDK